MIKLIQQTTDYNCGSAVLAMFFDTSIEDIEKNYLKRIPGELEDPEEEEGHSHGRAIGVTTEEICCILFDKGCRPLHVRIPSTSESTWYCRLAEDLPSVDPLNRIHNSLWKRKGTGILSLPSLNYEDSEHWVLVTGGKIYDPSTKKTYHKKFGTDDINEFDEPLTVCDAIIVNMG